MPFERSPNLPSSLPLSSPTLLQKILSRRKSNDENAPLLPSYHSPPPSPAFTLPPYANHWQAVEEPTTPTKKS